MAQAISKRGPVTGTAARAKKKKPYLLDLYSTSVGKKYVMAITGIGLMGFVFAHMVGNVKMYLGEEDLNHYSEFLRQLAYPILPENVALWLMRIGLIVMILLHMHAAYSLTVQNRQARGVKYQSERDYQVASFASRTMRWTGVIVLVFIIWHLLDLTFGVVNTVGASGDFNREEVYDNVVRSFDRWWVSAWYIIANIALGIHLFHGAWSIFQSLGWNNPRFNRWRRLFATGFATIIVVVNVSFPLAVLAGIVG